MDSPLPPLLQATSGAIGSAVGNAIVFPLDLATTRLQHAPKRSYAKKSKVFFAPPHQHSSHTASLIQTLQRLVRNRGFAHLYSGLGADTVSTLLSSFLYFLLYTSLRKAVVRHQWRPVTLVARVSASPAGIGGMTGKAGDLVKPVALNAIEELVIGLVAGVASKGITLPIKAICVRQQLGSRHHDDDENEPHHLSLVEVFRTILRESGFIGLFAALPPTVPLALLPSLTLYIHSVLLRYLVPLHHRAHPRGRITFLLGALSNALATIPLYPLVLLKALSQSGAHQGKDGEGSGVTGMVARIIGRDGYKGLYKGIEGHLAKSVVQQGVMMLVKQRIEERVIRAYRALA